MFEGKWGAEGSTTNGFEESMESVGPEMHDDVVLRRYNRGRQGRERDFEKIVADLRKPVDKSESSEKGKEKSCKRTLYGHL